MRLWRCFENIASSIYLKVENNNNRLLSFYIVLKDYVSHIVNFVILYSTESGFKSKLIVNPHTLHITWTTFLVCFDVYKM
jgi:hypothetical protein